MVKQEKDDGLKKIFRMSIIAGIFSQIFNTLSGTGSAFVIKFAIILNASPLHFSILAAIGQISQVFQPIGALITINRIERKSLVITFRSIGYGIVLFFGIVPFIFSNENSIIALIILSFFSVSLLSIADNTWIGWIADVIPLRLRGRFFSVLSQYVLLTSIGAGLIFGFLVDNSGIFSYNTKPFDVEKKHIVFAAIFFIGVFAAFWGLKVLSRMPEKKKRIEDKYSSEMLFIPFKDGNFRKFLFYNCWWMLAVGIGAPFWQPFMLQKLHMSLFEVQIYNSINVIAALLVLRPWGKLIDAYGNKTAMRLIITLGGFNPMVWLFVNFYNYHLLYIEAITSGIMWAGAGVVATNFVLSIAPHESRQLYAGISGAVSGLAMMTTMLISGLFLPQHLKIGDFYLEPEQVLFAFTGIARWSTQIPLSLVHESKSKPVTKVITFFINTIKPKFIR
ncbi:MAG: MFS transporter [Nitrospirae bacterium]|nr:MFS transporter [Nitrospirota bacterium]